ncbi:methenyltetrahydrofolate cyclohydrolase [Methylomonas koyamae]|uniref:Methenyltetrahydrofolate cyclohydrolase n=1 Tax=Methylomonas koyamae TaxID=702114 RepID=A0A177NKF9_9GAMM|nr:methenyltetrahydrofolate cyclohydrolase [Methylomonas koyamae]ATG91199.1 methenyltetrahydrofolate cyclohydrolase [Methylomonas koyamae]OAI18548.1 methenyltetrahydrofolate cyclohydrolase [Methylomonas koyamae]
MKEIKDKTVETFLDELASKQATPGGGSAAAVMGAQAAALVSMVCNLTIGKPKYVEVEAELRDLLGEAEVLRQTLLGMVKADVDVFDKLMACYGLPKTNEQEKLYRGEQIQTVLKEATLVPLACAKACAQAIELSRIAAEKGNLGVISDAGVAVMAAYAGLKSAALNVQINAAGLKDRTFAEAQLAELAGLLESAENAAAQVYQAVKDKL